MTSLEPFNIFSSPHKWKLWKRHCCSAFFKTACRCPLRFVRFLPFLFLGVFWAASPCHWCGLLPFLWYERQHFGVHFLQVIDPNCKSSISSILNWVCHKTCPEVRFALFFCWLPGELEDHRTSIWIGSQEDPEFWDELVESVPPIDIVIDDGSHVGRMQLETFQSLWPRLAPGGVYIVEDMVLAYLDMPSQDRKITRHLGSESWIHPSQIGPGHGFLQRSYALDREVEAIGGWNANRRDEVDVLCEIFLSIFATFESPRAHSAICCTDQVWQLIADWRCLR